MSDKFANIVYGIGTATIVGIAAYILVDTVTTPTTKVVGIYGF